MESKILIIQKLLNLGVKSIAIISHPDLNGGHDDEMYFSSNPDKDWYEDLPDFTYVEWTGKPIDLIKDWPEITSHKEPFHEEPRDYCQPWFIPVMEFLMAYHITV